VAQCADHILIGLDGRKPLDLDRAQARVLTGQKRQKVYGYGLSVVLQQWLRSGGAEYLIVSLPPSAIIAFSFLSFWLSSVTIFIGLSFACGGGLPPSLRDLGELEQAAAQSTDIGL